MRGNRYVGYLAETQRGYLVAFDLHWNVILARRIDPAIGAEVALRAFVGEFEAQGWTSEGAIRYGLTFMQREGIRILIEATPRDPHDLRAQTFSPFDNPRP
jgi:hypothetical protein